MRRVVAVIQARAGSTRLPRKVMRPLGDRPVLAWVIGAARDSGVCDEVVVATTTDPRDDEVAALAATHGAAIVRGPEDDVLTRYLMAADATHAQRNSRIEKLKHETKINTFSFFSSTFNDILSCLSKRIMKNTLRNSIPT